MLKFYRQKPIDHYIVDFYCAKEALVIELDWESHDTPEAQEYDLYRTEILEQVYNLKVIRFTNDEVFHSLEWVCKSIEEMLIARL